MRGARVVVGGTGCWRNGSVDGRGEVSTRGTGAATGSAARQRARARPSTRPTRGRERYATGSVRGARRKRTSEGASGTRPERRVLGARAESSYVEGRVRRFDEEPRNGGSEGAERRGWGTRNERPAGLTRNGRLQLHVERGAERAWGGGGARGTPGAVSFSVTGRDRTCTGAGVEVAREQRRPNALAVGRRDWSGVCAGAGPRACEGRGFGGWT